MTSEETAIREAFAAARVEAPSVVFNPADDYAGAGMFGYFDVGGLTVYPMPAADGGRPGWAIDCLRCTPGRRTLANGDPGCPDDWEPETLLPAFKDGAVGINGKFQIPTTIYQAARRVVELTVADRLDNAEDCAAYARCMAELD